MAAEKSSMWARLTNHKHLNWGSRAPKFGLALLLVIQGGLPAVQGPSANPRASGPKGDGSTLTRTSAKVLATVEREHVSLCTGPGGEHFKVDLLIRGPITSTDTRLSGHFSGHVRVFVKRTPLDRNALIGHGRDDFVIRDARGQSKANGTGFFVIDYGNPLRGMLFAKLRDGSGWISNFSVMNELVSAPIVLDDALGRAGLTKAGKRGPVLVEMGGPVTLNPSDPGLIQTGSCPGALGSDPLRDPPIYP